jgi:tetratricopeptide (TPR) repeat protein/predicted Ser/Thr protein kinase
MEKCPDPQTIADFVGGRLEPSRRREVEAHIDACRDCNRAVVRLLSAITSSSSGPGGGGPAAATLLPGASSVDLAEGTKLGRYILIRRLGSGGMGAVHAAYDTTLDRKVALKFLTRVRSDQNELAQIQAEGTVMARLTHPNVVTVHDVGVVEGRAYLAMEFVDGVNLSVWRAQQPRTMKEITRVMAGAARGLAALHAAGIVHRDVKPHNILVSGARVLVTDFGISIKQDAETTAGIAGTPAYMAPEQFRGEKVDVRTDVFGFCATLYEMIHGVPAFVETTPEALKTRLARPAPPPPPGSRAPARLHRLAARGLAVYPSDRPSDLNAFADELLADPGARRRRVGIGVAAVAAGVAAFWGGGYLKANPERQCRAGSAVMAGTWNEGRRQEIRRRFEAAGQTGSWRPLEQRLDDFAARWRAMHGETCTATYGQRRQSEVVLDLRMDCLHGQRATVDALVRSLPAATPPQLAKAGSGRLPVVAECEAAGRAGTKPLPEDPRARAEIKRIEDVLAQSEVQRFYGDLDKAVKASGPALEAARKLGYEPLTARALNQAGAIEMWRGAASGPSGERGVALLAEAVALAEVGRDDLRRTYAMSDLIMLNAFRDRYQEADIWAGLASALLTKLGEPPFYRALVDTSVGWLRLSQGQREASSAAYERALALRRTFLPGNHPQIIAALNGACIVKPTIDEQNACKREALALGESTYAPYSTDIASLTNNLAIGLIKRPRTVDEACPLFRKAISIKEAILDPANPTLLDDINNLGMCVSLQGKLKDALALFEKGLARAAPKSGTRARLQGGLGLTLGKLGRHEEGVRALREAQADRRALYGASNRLVMDSTVDLITVLLLQGRPTEALTEADAAIAACARDKATSSYLIDIHNLRGQALQALGRNEPAIAAHQDALRLHAELSQGKASSSSDTQLAEVAQSAAHQGIGVAQLALGRVDAARESLEKALALRVPGEAAPELRAETQLTLARVVLALGRDGSQQRACALGEEAIGGFRAAGERGTGQLREAQRWVADHRCRSS